jgi:hypothetical protein
VDISRAKAKAAAPIVKTSNIAELNQTLADSSPKSVGAAARMVTIMALDISVTAWRNPGTQQAARPWKFRWRNDLLDHGRGTS